MGLPTSRSSPLFPIVGCGVFLFIVGRGKVAKPTAAGDPPTTGHVWDEDLAEFNNPLPRWWSWLFYITVVFALVYLVLYPGLGKFPGVLGWTSVGQYQAERKAFDASVAPLYAKFLGMDVQAVAADPAAQAMGERLFLSYCAQCHGSDAGGGRGYPNLRDRDWLYGGEPALIKTSILEGRNGVMPPFGAVLGEDGVANVVAYVRSLSGLPHDSLKSQLGKPLFAHQLRGLSRRRRQGQHRPRRSQPHRQRVALRQLPHHHRRNASSRGAAPRAP